MKNGGYNFNGNNSLRRLDLVQMRPLLSAERSVTNYPATYLHKTEEKVGCLYRFENLKCSVTACIIGLTV